MEIYFLVFISLEVPQQKAELYSFIVFLRAVWNNGAQAANQNTIWQF